jgi:hypothetical protein
LLQCSNYQSNDEAVPLLHSKFQRLVMCAYISDIQASRKQKAHRNGWAFMHIETYGAGKEARTLDLYLGKVSLYQLSYSRIFWWPGAESNVFGKPHHKQIFKNTSRSYCKN